MLLFRSITTGLLGACFLFIAAPRALRTWFDPPAPHHHASAPPTPRSEVTVVDVAPGITGDSLPALLHLGAQERVLAVDDQLVPDDLSAGALLAERAAVSAHRSFIDLTVGTTRHGRRVLVLLH